MSGIYHFTNKPNGGNSFSSTSGKVTKPQSNYRTSSNLNKSINPSSVNGSILSNSMVNEFNVNSFGFGLSMEQQLLINMNNNLGKVMNGMTTTKYINEKAPLELAAEHVDALTTQLLLWIDQHHWNSPNTNLPIQTIL